MARRGGFTIGRGAVALQFSGELTRAVEETIRKLAPTVIAAVEREVDQIVNEAEAQWPRGDEKDAPRARNKAQPYHSQDRFISGIRYVGNNTIEGYIDNDAVNIRGQRYWWFIKSGGVSPLQTYVRKPLRVAAQRLAQELGDELRAMMRRA